MIQRQGIGTLRNSVWRGALRHEVWLDEELTRRIAPQVYADVKAGKPVEVSTGLFTENEDVPGSHHTANTTKPPHEGLFQIISPYSPPTPSVHVPSLTVAVCW